MLQLRVLSINRQMCYITICMKQLDGEIVLEILTGQRQCVLTCSSDNSVRTRVTQRRVCCVQVPQQPASEHACQELVRRTEHVSNTNSVRLISARRAAAVRAARRSRPADGRTVSDGGATRHLRSARHDAMRCQHARSFAIPSTRLRSCLAPRLPIQTAPSQRVLHYY